MLNLIKLAVGAADPAALTAHQQSRSQRTGAHGGRPYFWTRNHPRRADEILNGGSVYWVMSGVLLCRQRIVGFVPDQRDNGTPCISVVLDSPVTAVMPRLVRAFQGWRYLTAADAPDDLGSMPQLRGDTLPPALRKELAALCLL